MSQKPVRPEGSLARGFSWKYKDHNFVGYSIAGITTSLVYENGSMVFDVAQGLPFNIPFKNYFITHAHSDHTSGLPYVLSQRALWSLPPANIYMRPENVETYHQIFRLYHEMEGYPYEYNLHPFTIGEKVTIDDRIVEPFRTLHRVPSQGYRVSQLKKKLKPEYEKASPQELHKLRSQGIEINEHRAEGIFAFTGDTTADFLDHFKDPVSVLFMETTFIDEVRDIQAARHWGHVHLDEWVDKIESIPAEKIVLIHLSARYKTPQALEILKKKIPAHLQDKVELFPRPF